MSVPKNKRKESKLQVILFARDLASYTIKITKNENTFPPEYRWGVTNKIVETATSIYMDCWTANNIYVHGDAEKKRERIFLQRRAVLNCNNLLALMQLAQEIFHLKTKRVEYWGRKTITARESIKKWSKSDMDRL